MGDSWETSEEGLGPAAPSLEMPARATEHRRGAREVQSWAKTWLAGLLPPRLGDFGKSPHFCCSHGPF